MNYYNSDFRPTDTEFYAVARMWATGTIVAYYRYLSADDRALSLLSHLSSVAAAPLDDRVFLHPVPAAEIPDGLAWEDASHLGPSDREIACESAQPNA